MGKRTEKKPGPSFDVVHEAWQTAQAAWEGLQTNKMPEGAAFNREVSRRHDARERASEKLAATPAQNVTQLAAKTAAYWRILTCDFRPPATATMQCVEEEHVVLLRAINEDAQRLAKHTNTKPDPIFAALALFAKQDRAFDRLWDQLDEAEGKAKAAHGSRTLGMIMWRGRTNIEGAREEFLQKHIAPPDQIEREYLDAKEREKEARRADREWYKRTGLEPLRKAVAQARRARTAAYHALVKVRPTTPAGAAALLGRVLKDSEIGTAPWHRPALYAVKAGLAQMSSSSDAPIGAAS